MAKGVGLEIEFGLTAREPMGLAPRVGSNPTPGAI